MIAELYGKISSSGSNLSDRMEDQLTGDVFGALRYLPFHTGMAQILKAANIPDLSSCVEQSELSYWADHIRFWPYHEEGEMDVCLDLGNAAVCIEVKYNSGRSSEDEVDNSKISEESERRVSCDQLARESRIIKNMYPDKKCFLLFIARENDCVTVCNDVLSRDILEKEVQLGYVSWQEILFQLSELWPEDLSHRLILKDITALLKKKGFDRFRSFEDADAITVSANEWFAFNYQHEEFSFEDSLSVNEGDYYDFR